NDFGEAQLAQSPESRRHSNDAPASEENPNVADGWLVVPVGPESTTVCAAAVSTVQPRVAGMGSVLPAASVARTAKVCSRSGRPAYALGDEHATQSPASRRHSNDAPASEENAKLGDASFVAPIGPDVISVSGATVSTVQRRVAGVGSILPESAAL